MDRTASRPLLAALVVLTLARAAAAAPGDTTVLRSLRSPLPSPDGVSFDGEAIWVSDGEDTDVYRIDPETGSTIDRFAMTFMVDHLDYRPGFSGPYVWMSDHSRVYRVDRGSMEVVERVPAPGRKLMGVAEEGEAIWSLDPDAALIHKLDMDGEIIATLPAPGGDPCGIAWDGRCLWVSDLTDQAYYQVNPADGAVELAFDAPGGPRRLPTGIAFFGGGPDQRVFVADEDPSDPRIYELALERTSEGPCAPPPGGSSGAAGDPGPGADAGTAGAVADPGVEVGAVAGGPIGSDGEGGTVDPGGNERPTSRGSGSSGHCSWSCAAGGSAGSSWAVPLGLALALAWCRRKRS